MEVIEVILRMDAENKVAPASFRWQGKTLRVESVSKRWDEEDGEHFLLMTQPGDQVFEVLNRVSEGHWVMVKSFNDPRGKAV